MRANIPDYFAYSPKNLKEALHLLQSEKGKWKPLAGGTDLMVSFEAGVLKNKFLLNVFSLRELRGIKVTPTHVQLGALTTYSEIRAHPVLRKEFPNLCAAAQVTGAIAIQNRGTLGGNIMNASPAADSPPALMCYDAEVGFIAKNKSMRWVPLRSLYLGYKQLHVFEDELLHSIQLPRLPKGKLRHYYRKVGTRKAQAIAKVVMSATIGFNKEKSINQARISLGSVAAQTIRCEEVENFLKQQVVNANTIQAACDLMDLSISPIDDIRSTEDYRRAVTRNLLEDFLQTCGTG